MFNMIKLRKLPLLNHADFNFHNTLIATLYYAYCLTNSVKAICFSVLSKQHKWIDTVLSDHKGLLKVYCARHLKGMTTKRNGNTARLEFSSLPRAVFNTDQWNANCQMLVQDFVSTTNYWLPKTIHFCKQNRKYCQSNNWAFAINDLTKCQVNNINIVMLLIWCRTLICLQLFLEYSAVTLTLFVIVCFHFFCFVFLKYQTS